MSKLVWDQIGERLYETGVSKCVLYPQVSGAYPKGVAWNGITNVSENPSGAEPTPLYADDMKYLELMSAEEYAVSITAYMYPDEFAACNGEAEAAEGVSLGQQTRTPFGLCWKTVIGNDVQKNDYGYKLHIMYGGLAAPSEKSYATINDNPEAMELSWEVSTTPVAVNGFKPTASLVIDSTKVDAEKLAALEDILYGTEDTEARLPMPDEIIGMFKGA